MPSSSRSHSKLFQPLKIANGKIELKHRVVLAPMTRNRGVPLFDDGGLGCYNRVWHPDELMVEYYEQRATEGGLLISEGIPPNLEGNGSPSVPGLFHPSHLSGWRKVTEAVHAKGGFIYAQLWHAGRATITPFTGMPSVAPSAVPMDGPEAITRRIPPGCSGPVRFADYPPIELTEKHIKQTIEDYCNAARMAIEAGFDGVEVHGGNGYLPEQFLSSNINKRTDEYGGSLEKRCRFVIELMEGLARSVGGSNCAIRLSPFGLFNQTRGEQRVETWSHLCEQLKKKVPDMSYISMIEPRYEQIHSMSEKDDFIRSWGHDPSNINLKFLRHIMGDTPFFTAGGWNDTNCWGVLETNDCDALLIGRYFVSNPDLVERLRTGRPLANYDRSTFYGPFKIRHVGYTDYPTWEDERMQAEFESMEVIEGVEVACVEVSKEIEVFA
ncbi:FMN-linked oxidoreductase [Massarina eburnea CBS 473.64]|uniref:FMN-linked oxidoreductase n=1 Tax=Massarina eburnea CBS 473.64 TaxID=1395130 RepID=A0A6A6S821_9PLEO|nr:FMN-linked oxidoreductase [Massarina eburnea CBS 473.64]